MITIKRNKDCVTFHLSYWYQKVQEFLPLSMRYASLAFRTLSLLDLMSSSGISVIWLAEWSFSKKVFWDCGWFGGWFRDIRWIVNWSAVFVETVFESSFGFTYVLFGAVAALGTLSIDDEMGRRRRPEVKFSRANLLGMRQVVKTSVCHCHILFACKSLSFHLVIQYK